MENVHRPDNNQGSTVEDNLHEISMLVQIAQSALAQAEFSDGCSHCFIQQVRRALADVTTIVDYTLVDISEDEEGHTDSN